MTELKQLLASFVQEVSLAIFWAYGDTGVPDSLRGKKFEGDYFKFDGHAYDQLKQGDDEQLNRLVEKYFAPLQVLNTGTGYGVSEEKRGATTFFFLLLPSKAEADRVYPKQRQRWVATALTFLKGGAKSSDADGKQQRTASGSKRSASEISTEAGGGALGSQSSIQQRSELIKQREEAEAAAAARAAEEEQKLLAQLAAQQKRTSQTASDGGGKGGGMASAAVPPTPSDSAVAAASVEDSGGAATGAAARTQVPVGTPVALVASNASASTPAAAADDDAAQQHGADGSAQRDEVRVAAKERDRDARGFEPLPFVTSTGMVAAPFHLPV